MAQPLALCLRIIEYRQYARVKQAVDDAKKEDDMPDSPFVDLIISIEKDLLDERAVRLAAERVERLAREEEERRAI